MTTIVTCTELAQAQLLQSALEGSGVRAYLPDEFVAQTAPPYTWATGGVRLQVADEDVERARGVLAALEESQPAAPAAPAHDGPARPEAAPEHSAVVNLAAKFAHFSEQWSPKIIAALNGQHVKVVKVQGDFVWHRHEAEDELFLVVAGLLRMEFRDSTVTLAPGELIVVPRGVEHRPCAETETHVVLFEPAATINTGDVGGERTVQPEWI